MLAEANIKEFTTLLINPFCSYAHYQTKQIEIRM